MHLSLEASSGGHHVPRLCTLLTVGSDLAGDQAPRPGKISELFVYDNFSRVPAERVEAGDICAFAGLSNVGIGETINSPASPAPLPTIEVSFARMSARRLPISRAHHVSMARADQQPTSCPPCNVCLPAGHGPFHRVLGTPVVSRRRLRLHTFTCSHADAMMDILQSRPLSRQRVMQAAALSRAGTSSCTGYMHACRWSCRPCA